MWRPSEGAFGAEALVRDVSIASPLWGAPRICGELKLGIDVGQTTVAMISFRLLYGFLILHHGRREILWIGDNFAPSADWSASQLTEAFGWEQGPRYNIRDRDSA